MTAQERLDAAMPNLASALQDVLTKLKTSEADTLRTQLTQLQASYDQLQATHDETLNRVATWAEGMIDSIRQLVP